MSNMNTLPQTLKSFDRFSGSQDHGDADSDKARIDYRRDKRYDEADRLTRERTQHSLAIDEGLNDHLDTMTSEELDYAADQLLLDASFKENIEDSEELEDDETDSQRAERHEREDARAREVIGVQQIVFDAIKSRKAGKEYHARQATLDPELDDDDQEDYTPGFHITNRP